jgi:hypothetical protein
MRLFAPASTTDARAAIDEGFTPTEMGEGDVAFVVFRSRRGGSPPDDAGLDLLADPAVDFALALDVPDDEAAKWEARYDPPLRDARLGDLPYREHFLPVEVADRYRESLVVFDAADGEEVRPDLVGR